MADYDDDLAEEGEGDDARVDSDDKASPSKPWLDCIEKYNKAGFEDYQTRCDNIDRMYADIDRLANVAREREFQIFWANIQTIGPSIYSRAPVPVVVPRFRDRRPIPRAASELLERASVVNFEMEDIDSVMLEVRDDLVLASRGSAWLRYEASGKGASFRESVCIEHVDRRDFAHDPARKWKEVDWVARRGWLAKKDMRKRFFKTSGNAYKEAAYETRKDEQAADDGTKKAGVWEIWCKSENIVVWVTEGVDVCLDEGKPHLTLDGFWPCPAPAYGTKKRRTLLPVPDYLLYKDQIEEINEMTGRLSALAESLRLKGFYPAGAGEISDAIEAALKSNDNRQVLVPISNWATLGGQAAKDTIVWLPLDMVAKTITELIALRKQLIEDVYQITGISDIMRGSTEASETLGAQKLKSQFGSVRIRDRQDEMVRIARDITRIAAEIMAENFQQKTLVEMTQIDLPTDADIAKQAKALQAQGAQMQQELQHAQSDPAIQAKAQQNPQIAQQVMQQAQQHLQQIGQQIQKLGETVTIDKVMKLLKDQKLRPFVLDIETDSTIQPDEDAQKQRATEFVTAVGGYISQVVPLVQETPQIAPLASEFLKYIASQFRAGRELEGTIDEFADQMKTMASQPKPPPPEAQKAQAEGQALQQRTQIEGEKHQAEMAGKQQDAQLKQQQAQADFQLKQAEAQANDQRETARLDADLKARGAETTAKIALMHEKRLDEVEKHRQDMEKGALEIASIQVKIEQMKVQTENSVRTTEAAVLASKAKAEQKPAGEAKQ